MNSCAKHPHEKGAALCRRCGGAWCNDCLVYAFGPKKPPFCMSCAMFAGGVRSVATRPAMPKRDLKALQKTAKAEAKAAAKAGKQETPEAERDTAGAAAAVEVASPESAAPAPSPAASDWQTPWWEDRQPTFAD
jgi:hypothetical protein